MLKCLFGMRFILGFTFSFFFLKKQKSHEDLLPPPLNCWRRQWQPTPVLLPRTSHGGRSLVGYSPWGHKESDTAENFTSRTSLTSLASNFLSGEGNGNPLQYSCLENPWTEEPGGSWSMESQRVRHAWSD